MFANQNSAFMAEMESVRSLLKLTPEERKKEVRRKTIEELRALEKERRERAAKEATEKLRREREEEEEQVRRQREEYLEERRMQEAKQREEKQRKADHLTPERGRKKTLVNNWVGEPKPDREPVKESPHPNSSIYLLFSAKTAPKSEETPDKKPLKTKKAKQLLPDILRVGYWMDRYRDHHDRKDEKRKQKAEEQYAQWAALKARRAGYVSRQNDFYTGGFAVNRNSILRSVF